MVPLNISKPDEMLAFIGTILVVRLAKVFEVGVDYIIRDKERGRVGSFVGSMVIFASP